METQNQIVQVKKNEYKVFVVEDSDVYRTLLVESISKLKKSFNGNETNYVIYSFSSGEECLENMHLKPDVVILDYYLDSGGYIKNMDGLALLKKIKTLSPKTEVVALSCQTNVEVVKEMLKAGATHYIKKDNFSQIRVTRLIEKFIQKKEEILHKRMTIIKLSIFLILIIAAIIAIYFLNE